MKTSLSMLSLSIAFAVALAQNTPPNPSSQDTQTTTPANAQTKTGADTTASSTGSVSKVLPEMKTTTFKGVLVDMSCSSSTSGTAGNTPGPGGVTPASDQAKALASEQSNTASRSAGNAGAGCPLSANSNELGMTMNNGRTVSFDLVGNQRAQDVMKNNKRWSKTISENKPIHATVSGVLNGDKLIVSSIH